MKKIGIITMHKAVSYGSALQAYALQKKIEDLGYEAELIDYQYPNELHKNRDHVIQRKLKLMFSFFIHMMWGFPMRKKLRKFEDFYKRYFKLSAYYSTAESLVKDPPLYDLYVTGSDQVWNPNFIKGDASFLLGFVNKGKPRISYAASFAALSIPKAYQTMYKDCLSLYNDISVREKAGVSIVKALVNKEAAHVCDPTLLIGKNEWDKISELSNIRVQKPYILVFMLCYSFNPYPQARHIIHSIQNILGLHTIFLDGRKHDLFEPNSKIIKDAGPADFIKLIKNASYVITDSFHGTLFSVLYGVPFSAIVKSNHKDSRIADFLLEIGGEACLIRYDDNDVRLSSTIPVQKLDSFIDSSTVVLYRMIQSIIP